MLSTRTLNMASLRYDKRMLYDAVLRPLQHFKLELGRRLTAAEVAQIKVHLKRDLQDDILLKVTDGEDLIMLLDQYFGVDNIRLLERLLSLIECYDLLNALLDWKETDYPAKPEVFYECNYFPLWVKIVADISWFFQNRKGILRSLKILLEIPEIEAEDEDLDPLILMSVTSSKRSTLICTLLPVSMRRHVKILLRDTDVGIALERLRISGIYFSRKVGSRSGRDDLSVSSSILSLTDHFDEDRRSNGLASYTHHDTPPANFHNAEYYYKPVQRTDQFMGNGSERSPPNYGFVGQDRSPPHTMSSLHDYTKQPGRIFPSDEDPHPKVFEPKLSPDVSTPRSQASSEGVGNRMMRVRPQMAYINHEVYKVQTHSVVESAYKDKTCAQPEERILGDLRGYPVEENVVHSEASGQTYSLYEPLFSGQTQVDGPGKSETTSSKLPTERKVSLTNGMSYVSKLVIPINGKSSEPRSYSAEVFPNNSIPEVEKGCFEDTSYRQIYDDPISNDNEPRLVQRKDFSLVEQAPSWDGFPGHFEENSQVDSGDWYEGNGDTNAYNSQRMQPEPETTDFPEGASRFLEDDQFRMMQPEPEQNFFEVEGDFAASKMQDYADIPQRGGRPPKNSEVEIVKVRSKVLEHHQPQQTRHYPSDGSVNSFEEGANFNSNFLHPVPLTLPRIAPEQQDSNFFLPPRNQIPQKELQRDSPSIYRKYQDGTLEGSPRLPSRFTRGDADLQSDYADSVFTDTTNRSERDGPSFPPPPYNPPPEYKFAVKKKKPLRSVESSTASTETLERVSRSPLLSAESITSIYKEKEKFLSREELNLSVRSAEEKEEERLFELCKELLTAAKGGNEEEVKKLLAEGANMDYQNEFGHTAAMIASREGHLEVIEVLVAAKVDLNKQEWFGKSALHEAAWSGQHQIVHRLISAGATIDITDEEQRTPLHYAAMRGKRRIAEVLLLFGADVSLLNKDGKSAVEVAYSYEHDDIVDVLFASQDKRMRREMEGRLRREKLRTLRSAASLPNLVKATSIRELARSKSRSDLSGKKKSACVIQ